MEIDMPRFKSLAWTALLCLALLDLSVAWADVQIGAAPATRKILPESPMPEARKIEIGLCRNEYEAFQIAVRAPRGATVLAVSVPEASPLDVFEVTVYREHYLNVANESSGSLTDHERLPGFYPDPLIPAVDPYDPEHARPVGLPYDLAPGETAVLWVEFYASPAVTPGLHEGAVVVETTEGEGHMQTTEIAVRIEAWDVDLPRTVATAFGFGHDRARNYHGGPEGDPTANYGEIVKRYYQALREHHIDPTTPPTPDIAFVFDAEDDLLPVDWSAYDEALEPWMTGSYLGGEGVARFNIGRFRPGSGTGSMTETQYVKAARAYAEHLQEKGWWDRAYVYATDEPWLNGGTETWDEIVHDIDLLLQATPDWRYKTLITGSYVDLVGDRVGIWCPVTPMYEDWFYTGGSMAGREEYAERFAKGESLWFYACNANLPPYAGYDIDTAIGYEPRIVKWGAWFEHATGFLYWRVSYWVQDDPWNVYMNLEEFGELFARNGDGFLLYPGDHNGTAGGKGSPEWLTLDGPIVSYRLKQVRDGLEDWELFRMSEKMGGEAYARAQVARAYTRFGDFTFEKCPGPGTYCPDDQPWTLDENLLLDVRKNLGRKVQHLLHSTLYPDPEAETPDGDQDEPDEDGDADADKEAEVAPTPDGDADRDTAPPTEDGGGCQGTGNLSWPALMLLGMIILVCFRTSRIS